MGVVKPWEGSTVVGVAWSGHPNVCGDVLGSSCMETNLLLLSDKVNLTFTAGVSGRKLKQDKEEIMTRPNLRPDNYNKCLH